MWMISFFSTCTGNRSTLNDYAISSTIICRQLKFEIKIESAVPQNSSSACCTIDCQDIYGMKSHILLRKSTEHVTQNLQP